LSGRASLLTVNCSLLWMPPTVAPSQHSALFFANKESAGVSTPLTLALHRICCWTSTRLLWGRSSGAV